MTSDLRSLDLSATGVPRPGPAGSPAGRAGGPESPGTRGVGLQGPATGPGPASCPPGCAAHGRDRLLTAASVLTLVRTAGCVLVALAGVATGRVLLLGVALAVYWAGDVLDGMLARWRDEETLTGAVLDICADRLCVGVVYVGFLLHRPDFAAAVGVYLLEFSLVDAVLSLAFVRWPISSPNYYDRVDRLIWRLNWWPPAKVANSAVIPLLCVGLSSPVLALVLAGLLLVFKSVCLGLVARSFAARGERCEGYHAAAHRP